MNETSSRPSSAHRSWPRKFRDAFRGISLGVRGQSSFRVHLVVATAVIVCGFAFRVSLLQWCVLILCITAVLVAEMLNSALEWMAKTVDEEYNPQLGAALDIGSAAVLLASIGASIVGTIVFLFRLGVAFGWW